MERLSSSMDYWVNWIISDYTPFNYNERNFFISSPSRQSRFMAEEFFIDTYEECLDNGLLSDVDLNKLLVKHDVWNEIREKLFNGLIKDVETIKVNLFQNWDKPAVAKDIRKALADTRAAIEIQFLDKTTFDIFSAKATAQYCRQHFLVGSSIYIAKGKP